MSRLEILFVDLVRGCCAGGNCDRLSEAVQQGFPEHGVRVHNEKAIPAASARATPNLVLLRPPPDHSLHQAATVVRSRWQGVPMLAVLCAGWENPRTVLQFLADGLDDFFSCPFRAIDLVPRIQNLLRRAPHAPRPGKTVKQELELEILVGESRCFLDAVWKVPQIARSAATVLIGGETGTGKELFARAIHYKSARGSKPFMPVNCGALPDHLFENEMFGHSKGAYTDAGSPEKGLLAVAEGGTVFLDEVDTLSPAAQTKLLRLLQQKEYRPLGSTATVVADVRIIAASNADLQTLVKSRHFREDLFYRLNVIPLKVPALRDRVEDVPILANHFLALFGEQYDRPLMRFSAAAVRRMMAYAWPGNVREMESLIHRLVVLSPSDVVEPEDLDLSAEPQRDAEGPASMKDAKRRAVDRFERVYLEGVMREHEGNISHAAAAAGKERRSFQRLIRKYGLDRREYRA